MNDTSIYIIFLTRNSKTAFVFTLKRHRLLYDITNAGDVFFEVSVNTSDDVLPSMVETMNNGDSIQLLYNGLILMSDNASPLKSTKRVHQHRRKIEIDKLLQNIEEKERHNILNSSIVEFSTLLLLLQKVFFTMNHYQDQRIYFES